MFYQTTLRNVGLYTSLSFAALGYSRFYRGKSKLYNVALIVFSIVILWIAIYLTKYLIEDFERYQLKVKSVEANKWLLLPKTVYYFNIGVGLLGFYTLFREIDSGIKKVLNWTDQLFLVQYCKTVEEIVFIIIYFSHNIFLS